MYNRLQRFAVRAAAACGILILAAGTAAAQAAAVSRKAPPKPKPHGAWWYTGEAPPATPGPPDMTGVWYSGSTGDLSKSTLPGQEMVLTPYGRKRYDTVDHAKDPDTFCLPQGPGRQLMSAHPMMIVQRQDVITLLSESQRVFRLVYMDGRGHPEDLADYPEWTGSSIGKWEGDTLTVDTRGINDRTWIDTSGHEHSNQLHMTERFKLTGPNTFEYVTTYEDPVFFVKPFTIKRVFKRQIGDRIMDQACMENEKDVKNLVPTIGDEGRK
jgi:hypothetical protein